MDRLTFEGDFCTIAMCQENPCPYDNSCTQREVWDRLKAYEDTGLEPEEIEKAMEDCADTVAKNQFAFSDINEMGGVDHLRELIQAEKDGRLVVHGRWDSSGRYKFTDGSIAVRCTKCGCSLHEKEYMENVWNYCPVCGAKMELED